MRPPHIATAAEYGLHYSTTHPPDQMKSGHFFLVDFFLLNEVVLGKRLRAVSRTLCGILNLFLLKFSAEALPFVEGSLYYPRIQ